MTYKNGRMGANALKNILLLSMTGWALVGAVSAQERGVRSLGSPDPRPYQLKITVTPGLEPPAAQLEIFESALELVLFFKPSNIDPRVTMDEDTADVLVHVTSPAIAEAEAEFVETLSSFQRLDESIYTVAFDTGLKHLFFIRVMLEQSIYDKRGILRRDFFPTFLAQLAREFYGTAYYLAQHPRIFGDRGQNTPEERWRDEVRTRVSSYQASVDFFERFLAAAGVGIPSQERNGYRLAQQAEEKQLGLWQKVADRDLPLNCRKLFDAGR